MQKMVDELLILARTDHWQLEKTAFNLKETLQSALRSANWPSQSSWIAG